MTPAIASAISAPRRTRPLPAGAHERSHIRTSENPFLAALGTTGLQNRKGSDHWRTLNTPPGEITKKIA